MIKIDEKAMHKLREIAQQLYKENRAPSIMAIHLKALEIYLKQQGQEPTFQVKVPTNEDKYNV